MQGDESDYQITPLPNTGGRLHRSYVERFPLRLPGVDSTYSTLAFLYYFDSIDSVVESLKDVTTGGSLRSRKRVRHEYCNASKPPIT
jgi:hypothetical protein